MDPQRLLRENPLFCGATEEALREAGRVAVPYHFEEGEVLLFQDRDGELLHLLTSGAVRISRLGTGQLERTVSELYAPNLVGESALLLGGERNATVTATLPSDTLALHRPHLEMIARRDPTLLWNLARILAGRVRDLNDELIASGHSTDAALAHVLRGLYAQRVQAGIPDAQALPLTHADLMVRLSASRETVSRVLRRFQKQGLIRVADGRLYLLRPEVLDGYDPEDGQHHSEA
ncbi:Crp/Fnr family transcriptional regulator [Deinococcus sp. Marseille-Q6407]|uniref:Crp/Fnr family transcriptional regulator n=1 Tax=Deinococcus sp. Marseille-Q6407 TaxID=2969223 RepID=UPI0021C035D6|nr:Crp/Fnr family transcriptional regulator [Deinococcus sp. Marseille-Q6407]